MTDCKKALEELQEKVKAGSTNWSAHTIKTALGFHAQWLFSNAFKGSLDAAYTLHISLLPERIYNLAPDFCHVFPPHDNGDQEAFTGISENPARAWLLAILAALIAQEEEK